MAEQESAWALAQLESLSDRQREIVRQMADRLIRRVLYPVSRTLRTEQDPAGNVIPGEVKNLGSSFREPPS
jgi:glutamyl-tRNA reductase